MKKSTFKNHHHCHHLTEKLPKVKTCPSINRIAVWLLPAVTCVLGPVNACTRVGHPLSQKEVIVRASFLRNAFIFSETDHSGCDKQNQKRFRSIKNIDFLHFLPKSSKPHKVLPILYFHKQQAG